MTVYPDGMSPLAIGLFEKAICEAGTHAEAASALMSASAHVLTLKFGAHLAADIMIDVIEQSAAMANPAGAA